MLGPSMRHVSIEECRRLQRKVDAILSNRCHSKKGVLPESLVKWSGGSIERVREALALLGSKGKVKRTKSGTYIHLCHQPDPSLFYPQKRV